MSRPQAELAAVHLVRKANGPSPFVAFLDSYRRHAAGVPHELALIFKGFSSAEEIEPYTTLARDLPRDAAPPALQHVRVDLAAGPRGVQAQHRGAIDREAVGAHMVRREPRIAGQDPCERRELL